jgi:hypothetical protein
MASHVLEKVAQLASGEDDVETRTLIELCELHDVVLQDIENRRTENGTAGGSMTKSLVQCRISPSALNVEDVGMEADYYRAALFLSLQLLSRYRSDASDLVTEILGSTIQQSMLLLEILATRYSLCCSTPTKLPSQYPMLVNWIEREETMTDESSNLIASLDWQTLALEEDELIRMAYTSIPSENGRGAVEDNQNQIFVARMSASSVVECDEMGTVAVQLDPHRGVLRLQETSSSTDCWWAVLTASSETRYLSPSFVITNVIIHEATNSQSTLGTVEAQVGPEDGPRWLGATAVVIQQLKELQMLQKELESLWGTEQVEEQLVNARTELINS